MPKNRLNSAASTQISDPWMSYVSNDEAHLELIDFYHANKRCKI